ncbi:Neb-camp generating peptide-like protein [Daphnia pulex]|uniref:Neb-camp generating peptide-like protein n=1 Tax=Daphnia pulex TaxID=6669 RepID=E9FUJ9_DAPPU|nr:Neb-camp generating peptide-like protein [Daphnia pulex]|eukprot:EFX88741.1 Neb-camp generating peptide-like protein [Daphnia pulex]
MAGDHAADSQFTGMSRIFNSTTLRGRANVALATYGFIGAIILYNMVKPSKKEVKPAH